MGCLRFSCCVEGLKPDHETRASTAVWLCTCSPSPSFAIVNVNTFCTSKSSVFALSSHSFSISCKPCWARLPLFFSINNLFQLLIHPPRLLPEAGSRWISLGSKCTVCACWSFSLCPSGVISLNVCIFVRREKGAVCFPGCPYFVLICIVFVGFCASWLNDSCAVPLTFSSLLVFSLSLSCFYSFF